MIQALSFALCLTAAPAEFKPLPFLPSAAPAKRAVVVGIDRYPALDRATDAQKRQAPELAAQLDGGDDDAETMKLLFEASGYEVTLLVGARATKVRIEEAIANLEAATGPGDVAAFYFSGRGSVAPGEGGGQPSLVAVDGLIADSANDVPMSRLEAAAAKISASAKLLVILDACYTRPGVRSRGQEYRHYRDVRKCIPRPGEVRAELFRGDAVVLAASGTTGSAYEWREDVQTNRWAGAFTSDLSAVLAGILTEGTSMSYRDLLTTLTGVVEDRGRESQYMPGYRIFPVLASLGDAEARYRQPAAFTLGGKAPTTVPEPTRPEPPKPVVKLAERQELFDGQFRVAFQFDESLPETRVKALQAEVPAAKTAIEAIPTVKLVEQFGARPDRMLLIRASESGVRVSMANEPVGRGERVPAGEGKTLVEALAAIREPLERSAILYAITRTVSAGNSTARAELRLVVSKAEVRPGDTFDAEISATQKGYILLSSHNEGTGLVNLAGVFPHPVPDFSTTQGNRIITALEGFPVQDPVPGRVVIRALLMIEGPGWRVPAGPMDANGLASLPFLRSVRDALAAGKAQWQGIRVDVRIVQ